MKIIKKYFQVVTFTEYIYTSDICTTNRTVPTKITELTSPSKKYKY